MLALVAWRHTLDIGYIKSFFFVFTSCFSLVMVPASF